MRYLLAAILFFLSLASYGQQINYTDWQEEAKKDDRLLPEYGKPRTPEQCAADEAYIKTALQEMNTDGHNGSEQMVELGFKYIAMGDLRVAMYRFNQAWLLDQKNSNVYAGFGSVYFMFKDFSNSIKHFNKGLELDPRNTNLLSYLARTYLSMYEASTDTIAYYKVLPLLSKAYHIDSTNMYTLYMLSRFYIRSNNCDSSLKYFYKCKKLGGQPITEQYERGLKTRCNIKE
jgi:cytochrome c-type biogenesis protein CcmH/NrfG